MTSRAREAVAVLAHATSQQRLAGALEEAARQTGLSLALRTLTELSTETSIRQEPGRTVSVQPDRPMLWLAVGDPAPDDPDERFARAEAYAAARSVAILTTSPVLNRPTAFGSQGSLPVGPVAALRGLPQRLRDKMRTERFGSHPAPSRGAVQEVLDYATGSRSLGCLEGVGPFRTRAAAGRTAWVTVAGARTFGPAVDGLHEASREAATSYGLGLAHVWWTCWPYTPPALARVDTWAWDAALGRRIDDVARALVAWCNDPGGEPS